MKKIEIELDKQTLEDAKLLAEARQCTLPELMAEVVKQLGSATDAICTSQKMGKTLLLEKLLNG